MRENEGDIDKFSSKNLLKCRGKDLVLVVYAGPEVNDKKKKKKIDKWASWVYVFKWHAQIILF